MTKKTKTPRERRHARTRQDILNTALELIMEKGADNLSLREIARRVDYSPAGLYEYFGSKEEIIDAVCVEADERFYQMLKAVDNSLPLRDYIIELGMAYINFACENTEQFLFLYTNFVADITQIETVDNVIDMQALINPDNSFGMFYHVVQQAMDAGLIKPHTDMNTLDIVYAIWSLVHGMAMLQVRYLKHFPYDFSQADRNTIEALLDGLG